MIIAIGNDHIVTDTKIALVDFLKSRGHTIIDVGTHDFTRTHYPIFGKRVGELVASGEAEAGVVICGTGIGISNAVNKVPGARCALVRDMTTALWARRHLGANVVGFGGRICGQFLIQDITEAFINETYEPTAESEEIIERIDATLKSSPDQGRADLFDDLLAAWDHGDYDD